MSLGSISNDMQDGTELLARQLRRAREFDEMRRDKAAVNMRFIQARTP